MTINQPVTVYNVSSWLCAIYFFSCSGLAFSQTANTANRPPSLLDGTRWEAKLKLVYREANDHTSIITVRFRISKNGMLDSLQIEGGPTAQKDSLYIQLARLNGKWKPQYSNGKPVMSKWMGFRWYISGFYGLASGCEGILGDEIKAAYDREESLFQCTAAWNKAYTCRTYFFEGADYFWYSPFYSRPVR